MDGQVYIAIVKLSSRRRASLHQYRTRESIWTIKFTSL